MIDIDFATRLNSLVNQQSLAQIRYRELSKLVLADPDNLSLINQREQARSLFQDISTQIFNLQRHHV